MNADTITIYARIRDPLGVLTLLRTLCPAVEVEGRGKKWKSATVSCDAGTFTFFNDPSYYEGDDWARQMSGMKGFLSRWGNTPHKLPVLRATDFFTFSLATGWEPDLAEDDERLQYLFAVAEHLDGILFLMSEVRDARGRLLMSGDGRFDAQAGPPRLPEEARPTAQRVARRALALAAVSARGFLDQHVSDDLEGGEQYRGRLLKWVEEVGFGDELEPDERDALQRPAGGLDEEEVMRTTWRLEGLSVLLWALGLTEFPPHDQMGSMDTLCPPVGFLDAKAAKRFLKNAALRPAGEIDAKQRQLFSLHWRLREYHLRPKAMDFVAFAQKAWFGPFDLTGLPLIDNDLAIGGAPIHGADSRAYGITCALTHERHLAANWLLGHSEVYSETDTPT
jgi:hypothetical protein